MSSINFETKLLKIKDWTILRLPEEVSAKLPTRGMSMVAGSIHGKSFKTLLEPDGKYGPGLKPSHWFRTDNMPEFSGTKAGDSVTLEIESTKEWVEPEIPEDVKKALKSSPSAEALWKDITPSARWDWIRWVRAVKTPETRQKHLDVMLDKLNKGMRRPCCFNRNLCSEPYVARNWVLIEPTSN